MSNWYKIIEAKEKNTLTLEQFKERHYGEPGTTKHDKLEAGYKNFKTVAATHDAGFEMGITKPHISKIKSSIKKMLISIV